MLADFDDQLDQLLLGSTPPSQGGTVGTLPPRCPPRRSGRRASSRRRRRRPRPCPDCPASGGRRRGSAATTGWRQGRVRPSPSSASARERRASAVRSQATQPRAKATAATTSATKPMWVCAVIVAAMVSPISWRNEPVATRIARNSTRTNQTSGTCRFHGWRMTQGPIARYVIPTTAAAASIVRGSMAPGDHRQPPHRDRVEHRATDMRCPRRLAEHRGDRSDQEGKCGTGMVPAEPAVQAGEWRLRRRGRRGPGDRWLRRRRTVATCGPRARQSQRSEGPAWPPPRPSRRGARASQGSAEGIVRHAALVPGSCRAPSCESIQPARSLTTPSSRQLVS